MARAMVHKLTVVGLLLAIASTPAYGNSGPPWSPGDAVGEPHASLADIHIVNERLVVDLSLLERGEPVALVSAGYTIRNDGPAQSVTLDFIAPDTRSVHVTLDGEPLIPDWPEGATIPPEWRPPESSPAFGSAADPLPIYYANWRPDGEPGALVSRFEGLVPPGEHRLTVEYSAEVPTLESRDGSPYETYQFAYVWAPARQWASFGTLDLEVAIPQGWEWASSVPLTVSEGLLAGDFDGLPSDDWSLSTRPPVDPMALAFSRGLPWAMPVVLVLFGLAFGWRYGARRSGSRIRRVVVLLLITWLAGVVGAIGGGILSSQADLFLLTEHIGSSHSYGHMLGALFVFGPLSGLAAMVGILAGALAWKVRNRSE